MESCECANVIPSCLALALRDFFPLKHMGCPHKHMHAHARTYTSREHTLTPLQIHTHTQVLTSIQTGLFSAQSEDTLSETKIVI
jgi:hypothetical protein